MKGQFKFDKSHPYDVIVCGAGHAGCEAALASARLGADVLVLTGNIDTIAQMSCNPAIGGQAKGQIVGEIDALGGAMGVTADMTAIQFRELNTSKGPAVRARRAQCDKKAYQFRMKHILELEKNLSVFQSMVTGLIFEGDKVVGVETNLDISFYAKTVVITAGTFLRGLMHIGSNKTEGGRIGDFAANTLSNSFIKAGIELERLKTGTPARILGSSIDFSKCEEQAGDEIPKLFAFYDTREEEDLFHVEHPCKKFVSMFHVEQSCQRKIGWKPGSVQVPCWVTNTTEKTQEVVNANLKRSALYGGEIVGTGPRYCPSIEDKYVKFTDKAIHRIYLEPEGINTDEWYINGLSTSLPFDVQQDLIHSIDGLEHASMLKPAYAVEYDFAPPTQLYPSLESKKVENLFFAGQVNGTSGYEEAAGQGLVAGVNAVMKIRDQDPLIMHRHDGYIGVLIDDLVTKGTSEPYRMFTSRAEHRLLFNHGSAELRLFDHAESFSLLPKSRLKAVKQKIESVNEWVGRLEKETTSGGTWGDVLRRAQVGEEPEMPQEFQSLNEAIKEEVFYRVKYKGYLDRDKRHVVKLQKTNNIKIPQDFDYEKVRGLKAESAQKLKEIKPISLGQASRISGINPADISILMILIEAWHREKREQKEAQQ